MTHIKIVQMVQHLVNRIKNRMVKFTVLLVMVCSTPLISQLRPPQFIGDSSSQSSYKALSIAIGSGIDSKFVRSLNPCYAGIGTFSFIVKKEGIIDIVNFEGNLPDSVIAKIKQNIYNTSGKWMPQMSDSKPTDSMPFILIYYVNVLSCPQMPLYQRNEHLMSFLLEKVINSKENKDLNVLNNAYLLPIGGFDVMR
jgi:hypothetical protein